MTTAEEMIERAALAIAKNDRCIRDGGPSSLCHHECACKRQARAVCAVAVEMCAKEVKQDDHAWPAFPFLSKLATAVKGE